MEVMRPTLIRIGGRIYRKNPIREKAHPHEEEEEEFYPGKMLILSLWLARYLLRVIRAQQQVLNTDFGNNFMRLNWEPPSFLWWFSRGALTLNLTGPWAVLYGIQGPKDSDIQDGRWAGSILHRQTSWSFKILFWEGKYRDDWIVHIVKGTWRCDVKNQAYDLSHKGL